MKKNVIYVDFRFTHKKIISKKLHLLYKVNSICKKFLNLFTKDTQPTKNIVTSLQPRPFKKIL